AARMRAARLEQLGRDSQSWQRRRDGALAQLSTLDQRMAEVDAQLSSLAEAPEGFESRKAQLDDQIERAKIDHKASGDRLAEAQTRWREADKAVKAAGDALNAV